MDSVGSRLKKAREKKGYTQVTVAKNFGVTNGAISGYERDYREPDNLTLVKFAELYEVSIDWLLGRTNNPNAVLSEPARALVDKINADLEDEEILDKINFNVGGEPVPEDIAKDFLSWARVQMAIRKQKKP